MAKGLTDSQHYTDIAAAIRAKKGTSETLTPGQMAAEISGIFTAPTLQDKTVTPSSEQQTITADEGFDGLGTVTCGAVEVLPTAESSAFGDDDADVDTGIIALGTLKYETLSYNYRPFNKYTANEDICIVGLRLYVINNTAPRSLRLFNASGEKVRETSQITPALNSWTAAYFDEPVIIAKGESFVVSASAAQHPTYSQADDTTINGKVTFNGSRIETTDDVPVELYPYYVVGVVDFIIGRVSAELPDQYQISRTTMDDIANEAKRITGTTGKITIGTILTTLEGIATPTA